MKPAIFYMVYPILVDTYVVLRKLWGLKGLTMTAALDVS